MYVAHTAAGRDVLWYTRDKASMDPHEAAAEERRQLKAQEDALMAAALCVSTCARAPQGPGAAGGRGADGRLVA